MTVVTSGSATVAPACWDGVDWPLVGGNLLWDGSPRVRGRPGLHDLSRKICTSMGMFLSMGAGFGKIKGISTMSGQSVPQDGRWTRPGPAPRGTGEPRPTSDWTGERLSAVLSGDQGLMVPDLESRDRMGAIKELVDRMHLEGSVIDSLAFLQSVMDREDVESTVVGAGVAFPPPPEAVTGRRSRRSSSRRPARRS